MGREQCTKLKMSFRNEWLDAARFFSICAVVLLHVAGVVLNRDPIGSLNWWAANVYESASRWCVPVFVMISGALLLDPSKKESVSEFYKKRLSKILIPTLFWSCFFLLYGLQFGLAPGNPEFGKVPLTTGKFLQKLLMGEPHYHMWFLYMIVGLYFFTPVFRIVVSNSTRSQLVIFTSAALVLVGISFLFGRYAHNPANSFLASFVYYIPLYFLGYLISTTTKTFSYVFLISSIVIGMVVTAVGFYVLSMSFGVETGLYFYGYLSFNVMATACFVMFLFKKLKFGWFREFFIKAGPLVLGVYLVHTIFLEAICAWGLGPLSRNRIFSIPLVTMVVLTLSFACVFLMRRIPFLRKLV